MNAPRAAGTRWLTAVVVMAGLCGCHPGRLLAAGSPYANTGPLTGATPPDQAEQPPPLVVQPPKDIQQAATPGDTPGGPPPQQAPEPGSLLLGVFGSGAAGLAAWVRRRRAPQSPEGDGQEAE